MNILDVEVGRYDLRWILDNIHLKLVFYECWVWIFVMHESLNAYVYTLIVKCELTPSGRLVDHLPYSYGWIDDVQEKFVLAWWVGGG